MLTRLARGAAAAAAAALALVFLTQAAAFAGGGPSAGNGFGFTQCGQSSSPSCTVTAGTGGANGTPGTAGAGGSKTSGGGTTTATFGGGGATGCSGTMNKSFGCVPKGCSITVQTLACPIGVPGAPGPANPGAPPALPAPGVLAQLAVKYLQLPDPVIRSSPTPAALQLTQLPVWLWVAAGTWQPQSKTAQVPGESVTATATPVSAAWSMGDGTTVTCAGPGTPYGGGNPAAASPTCGYTYTQSSAGQPGGAYRVTVTITWNVTWTGPGGAGGALAPLQTVAAAQFRVAESQALNTSGG